MASSASTGRSGDSAQGALLAGIALLAVVTLFWNSPAAQHGSSADGRRLGGSSSGDGGHPYYALVFPIISLLVGVVLYYIIGRLLHHAFPYTAAMFLFGTIMGLVLHRLPDNQVTESFDMWANIDGHLLLQGFLPGLLFRDAYSQDIHLFLEAFGQCAIMAFPEVLAGTALTACVLTFVFPYMRMIPEQLVFFRDESFIFSMVLGSILCATDPVAVSALLNEVGAPPRLKTHIAGESLLNDGSAFVFFNIFYNMDLYRFTNGKHGTDFDWGSGIVYFLKLSLGSAALGTAIGLVLVIFVWALKHRYNHEENVVQVMTTLAFAYFAFYVSESMLHLSGIVSVVFCGIVTKKFASTLINDKVGMQKFWDLLEHVLNTILFTIGGLVWGTVVVGDRFAGLKGNSLGLDSGITGRDWGYLFLLYIFLLLIRTFLVMGFYPLVSRIGLRSNFSEAIFMSWGGLRGAVGIALGIVIENGWVNVRANELVGAMERAEYSEEVKGADIFWYRYLADSGGESNEFEIWYHRYVAHIWFFFAGGIAFLTLVINGTTAGPLLKKLGLAAPTKIREAIVKRYRRSISLHSIEHLVQLLADAQFSDVDFAVVRRQVSDLRDIKHNDLIAALRHNRAKQPLYLYREPDISSLEPFFTADQFNELKDVAHVNASDRLPSLGRAAVVASSFTGGESDEEDVTEEKKVEMRKVYMALLRRAYETLINKGFIDARANARLVLQLTSSVEMAGDKVAQGEPISDWEVSRPLPKRVRRAIVSLRSSLSFENKEKQRSDLPEFMEVSAIVRHAVAFITAHKLAQETFKAEFAADRELSLVERLVLDESDAQISLAEDALESNNPADVVSIKTQLVCNIILNQTVHDVWGYLKRGLLLKTEAEQIVHDLEHELEYIAHHKHGVSNRDDERSSFKDDADGETL